MAHKTFETQRRALAGERVTFEIPAGSGRIYEATPDCPGGALLNAASLDGASPRQQLVSLGAFLDSVLLPESRARFETALNSPDPLVNVTLAEMTEIVRWLIEEVYVGRPTTPASGLAQPESQAGPNSMPVAPLQDSTL